VKLQVPRISLAGWSLMTMVLGLTSLLAVVVWTYFETQSRNEVQIQRKSVVERGQLLSMTLAAAPLERRKEIAAAADTIGFEVKWEPSIADGRRARFDEIDRWRKNRDQRTVAVQRAYQDRRAQGQSEGDTAGRQRGVRATIAEVFDERLLERARTDSLPTYLVEREEPGLLKLLLPAEPGWVSITARTFRRPEVEFTSGLWWTVLWGVVICIPAGFAIWRLNRPLVMLASAAQRLERDVHAPPVPEVGARELRDAARAFNDMQRGIQRLLRERTTMLAAISHDLRTPIQRLRFRGEFIEESQRDKFYRDLDEMDAMITQALALARDDATSETLQELDLSEMLRRVTRDQQEMGRDVTLRAPAMLRFRGRPLALKRCVQNLVDNAVAYGDRAMIELAANGDGWIRIAVADEGPGIPDDKLQTVLSPFERLDRSRSKKTGGFGLGLAVARSIVESHDGKLTLANRQPHGLLVTMNLPEHATA
jgi:signal transduction histidine kinase